MNRLVSIDGEIVPPERATVSVYDRGFLYGDSVFETIRTYGGVPFALPDHMARLGRSAALVAMPLPLSIGAFEAEVRTAVTAAANAESYVRAMVTRGSGPLGLDPSEARHPLRVILVEPLHLPPPEVYRAGVGVITRRTERAGDAVHGAKVGNYLASMLALAAARAAGAHEALILDAAGRVVEGTTSNVFVVRDGRLCTPPLAVGILPGITRAHLLAVAPGAGVAVDETPLEVSDVLGADEVFLSSSLREVLPVVRVDGRTIGSGHPGPVTRRLHEAFRRSVGLSGTPMPWE